MSSTTLSTSLSQGGFAPLLQSLTVSPLTTVLPASRSSLVFIDASVTDTPSLIAGAAPGTEVHVLDSAQDAIAQITQVLLGRSNIDSVHVISHGESGSLQFGSNSLTLDNLSVYANQLQTWGDALTSDADIFLYGCNVAEGTTGQAFLHALSQLTQADVAASDDVTGSAALGGDWDLEVAIGSINPALAFTEILTTTYGGIFAPILTETFTGSDVTNFNWRFGVSRTGAANPFLTARSSTAISQPGGLPGGTSAIDSPGQGALRLTNAAGSQGSFVIYDQAIPASDGLTISFDMYLYGGSGADGISFFLIDGSANPTTGGGTGGSLGYSRNDLAGETGPGIVGGYLGIGFDAFGNFSAPQYGDGGPGRRDNSVVLRGREAIGYDYLTGTQLSTSLDFPNVPTSSRTSYTRGVQIDISPAAIVSVRVDLNNDGDFNDVDERPIVNFDVATANGAGLPSTFKFGFGAATGGSTNIHEINNYQIDPYVSQVSFASNTQTVSENAGTVVINAQLDVPVSTGPVTVPVTLTGTATNNTDYTVNTTLTFNPNSSTGTLNLGVIDDALIESNETVILTLGTPTSGNARLGPSNTVFTLTINDNDAGGPDTVAPTATLTPVPTFRTDCASSLDFTVIYSDNVAVNFASADNQDIRVTGPNGFNQLATLVGITPATSTTPLTAVYRLAGPAGFWDRRDNGTYTISLQTNQISDATGNFVAAGTLGTFAVQINPKDFNGDGFTDIVWRDVETGRNVIWLMNGTNLVQEVELPTVANPRWVIEGVGDFSGDGRPDIVWRNYDAVGAEAGLVNIWVMNGASAIGTLTVPLRVTNRNWRIEGVGDFNGDCKTDIIWRNYDTVGPEVGLINIWTMDGAAPFGTLTIPQPRVFNPDWVIEGIEDYNNDGNLDILWRCNSPSGPEAGLVSIWTMNGATPTGTVTIPLSVTDGNWRSEAVGDFNGDNLPDILWRNYATGVNLVWTVQNNLPFGQLFLTPWNDLSWHVEDFSEPVFLSVL